MLRNAALARAPALFSKVVHSKGLRPLPPTPPQKKRRIRIRTVIKCKLKFIHFQRIAFKFEANGVCSGPQECHFGNQKDSQMIKNRPFLIRGAPDAPPGAPKASWTAYTAADYTLPPGTLEITLYDPAPAPGPGETTFTYHFLPLSLYLLASNMCLLVDPHAAALRGRRIRKGCALCRRPRKNNTSHSNSNFNQVDIKIPSFSTHRCQI